MLETNSMISMIFNVIECKSLFHDMSLGTGLGVELKAWRAVKCILPNMALLWLVTMPTTPLESQWLGSQFCAFQTISNSIYYLLDRYKKFLIVKNSVITPVPRRGRPVIEAKQKVNPLREALYANDLDCTKVHKARTKLFGMKLWFVRNYIKRDLNQSFRNLFWIYYSDLKKKYHPSKKKPTTAGAMCGGTIRLASCSPEGCEGFFGVRGQG